MITVFFDKTSSIPLYEQLYRHVRDQIQTGGLLDGAKLPSKRQLSAHLHISLTTVDLAYQQLVAEGYLKSIPKSGFFVEPFIHPEYVISPNESLRSSAKEPYEFELRTNVIDASAFPLIDWMKHEKKVMAELPRDVFNQGNPQGYLPLREEIARYLLAIRGIQTAPERIIVGAGSEYLIQLLLLILSKNNRVAIENPGYGKWKTLYEALQIGVEPVDIDESGFSVANLRATEANLVHVSPSHQFPSGKVMPVSRRMQLLNWANEAVDRHIIEDDYDSEFRFSGSPIPAMKSLDSADKVIYLNSFTKSMAPTFRMSYLVLPKPLLEKYQNEVAFLSNTVSILQQVVMADYMHDGSFERHVNRMRIVYRTKRDHFITALKASPIGEKITITGEEAGLHFLIECLSPVSETALIDLAKQQGVLASGLNEYRTTKGPAKERPTIVVGYSGLPNQHIEEIVRRLNVAWLVVLSA